MFRVPLLVFLTLAIAFSLGISLSIVALKATVGFGAIRLGPWEAYPVAQSADADPYAKAHRARFGRLLYGAAEGLVFTALRDDTGHALEARCRYRLIGQTPTARAWTLFASAPDGSSLAIDPSLPTGLNSINVLRQPDSSISIAVARNAQPMNWLALPRTGRFRLNLTLLDTPTAGSSGLIDLSMPKIQRTDCQDD